MNGVDNLQKGGTVRRYHANVDRELAQLFTLIRDKKRDKYGGEK
jgi:hypothetical protein